MDILDKILNAQKSSRDQKVENFKSLFAEEDNVAVQTALAKAKQVEEMERLKAKHEQELEALQDEHDRENERLKGAKEKEVVDIAIKKKRDAERKANESVEEGKLVSNIQDIIDVVMKKINKQVGKEIQRNQEKGLGMLNTLGSFVGAKVTDKKQDKGKLFLKFGDNLDESVEERYSDVMRKRNQSQQKAHQKAMMKSAKKSIKDYDAKNKNKNEESEVEEGRNYAKERANYHSRPEQMEKNAARKRARRALEKEGKVKPFDKKDVHHKDNNPLNNDRGNLSVVSQKYNRTEPRLRTEKLSKDATIGDFIKDFNSSDAPQFKNQSAEEIKKMAVAAYYANQKRG
jgi:hypothetical protein